MRMKKAILLLCLGFFLFPGCKFINNKILKKDKDTLLVYTQELQEKLIEQDLAHKLEIERMKKQSQARMDSIIEYYEKELGGTSATGAPGGKYHLITGGFKTPAYASGYLKKMKEMGYSNAQLILADNGFRLVSVESYNNLGPARDGLRIVRSDVAMDSWIYVN